MPAPFEIDDRANKRESRSEKAFLCRCRPLNPFKGTTDRHRLINSLFSGEWGWAQRQIENGSGTGGKNAEFTLRGNVQGVVVAVIATFT